MYATEYSAGVRSNEPEIETATVINLKNTALSEKKENKDT